MVSRILDIFGRKSGHFGSNLSIFGKKKLEHCGFMTHFKMKEIGEKTHICSISSVILGLNSENIYFGHSLVENQDTGRKKSFRNSV